MIRSQLTQIRGIHQPNHSLGLGLQPSLPPKLAVFEMAAAGRQCKAKPRQLTTSNNARSVPLYAAAASRQVQPTRPDQTDADAAELAPLADAMAIRSDARYPRGAGRGGRREYSTTLSTVLVQYSTPPALPVLGLFFLSLARRVQLDASFPPPPFSLLFPASLRLRPLPLLPPPPPSSVVEREREREREGARRRPPPGSARRRRSSMAAPPSRSRGDYDHLIKLLLIGDSGACFPPPPHSP